MERGDKYAFLGMLIIMLIVLFRGCGIREVPQHSFEMKKYETLSGREVVYTTPKVVTSKDGLSVEINDKLKDLRIKKPEFITIIKQRVVVDTVKVYYDVVLPCDSFDRVVRVDSPNYSIDISLNEEYLSVDRVEIPSLG